MNHLKKNYLLALVAGSLVASASAHASIINYDFNVTIDTVTASLFNQTFAGSFSFDDAQVPAPGFGGELLYKLADFTFEFAGMRFTNSALLYGDAALLNGTFLGLDAGGLEFAFLPATAVSPASFAYDFGQGDAGNARLTYLPLVGPIPEPSIRWLLVGGLLALAGLTRGSRGLHESV